MAIGERKKANIGEGYKKSSMYQLAKQFKNLNENIFNETYTDIITDPMHALRRQTSVDTLRHFFVNESADPESMTPAEYEVHLEDMNEIFTNDVEGINEYANLGTYNPVIGLSFPLHKNLLMNCVYNQFLPHEATRLPKVTLTMEDRFLVTPQGEEINMFTDQHRISEEMNKAVPFKEVEVKLPELGTTNVIEKIGGSSVDHLSIATYISAVRVEVKQAGDGVETGKNETSSGGANEEGKFFKWIPVNMEFKPGYGEFERTLNCSVNFANIKDELKNGDITDDIIVASMHKDQIMVSAMKGAVSKVKVKAKIDSSNGLSKLCSVKWKSRTELIEIPEATPISVAISPEEVKDISALYNENQLTKVMSMINDVMANHKDDNIKSELDHSFETIDPAYKISGKFDFKPRTGYALDNVEWRHKTFFDVLDTFVTDMYNVLNDPNVTVSIIGKPDLIRKLTPTEYSYQAPSNIGPVELNYNKTVVTSDKRVYNFMSSQKLKNDNTLTLTLHPRNTNRLIYKIYDYQMYVSNEIRNATYHTLPAITAFERWKFVQYQPVQGRIEILNPSELLVRD